VDGEASCDIETSELCDSVDNDCDDKIDEDFSQLGDACDGDDADDCANGQYVCAPDGQSLRCTTEGLTNLFEQCDGLDNDCDSKTDESFPELGSPCDGTDSDLCPMGALVCSENGQETTCGPEDPSNIVEICDEHDNDCNGIIDDVPGGCNGGSGDELTPCTYHTDCYPERVCALWKQGQKVCSEPCAGNSDCGDEEICSKLPGSAQIGYCHDAPSEGAASGMACNQNSECSTELCVEGKCVNFCLNESNCTSTQQACSLALDTENSSVTSACLSVSNGSVITGGSCQGNSANCESGHCDLSGTGSGPWYCASLCKSEIDCLGYQECNIVAYSEGQNADAIPFDTEWQVKTHDAITACYTPAQAGGWKIDGMACSSHSECTSYKCFPLIPGDPQNYCTSMCSRDSNCLSNMKCKMTAGNLVSSWLTDPMILTQGPMPTAYSFIRICTFQ